MNIAICVSRGAALLDVLGPSDWAGQIDTNGLDIKHGKHCILGQLYRSAENRDDCVGYTRGTRMLGLSMMDEETARHGFCLYEPLGYTDATLNHEDGWELLKQAWFVEIQKRIRPSETAETIEEETRDLVLA